MQRAVEPHTEAPDRAGVMRNLRFDQHKMERSCHAYRILPGTSQSKRVDTLSAVPSNRKDTVGF